MPVYIDNANRRYRGMLMCHMIADTTAELLEMVDRIGMKRSWIQDAGTWREHFDVCATNKRKALQLGAVEITEREMARKRREKQTTVT